MHGCELRCEADRAGFVRRQTHHQNLIGEAGEALPVEGHAVARVRREGDRRGEVEPAAVVLPSRGRAPDDSSRANTFAVPAPTAAMTAVFNIARRLGCCAMIYSHSSTMTESFASGASGGTSTALASPPLPSITSSFLPE